jgi:hypothetical protein
LVIWHSDDALKSTYCGYWTGDDDDDYCNPSHHQIYEQLSFFLIPWVVDVTHHQLKSKNGSATPGSCFKVAFLKVAVKQQQNKLAMPFVVIVCYRSGIFKKVEIVKHRSPVGNSFKVKLQVTTRSR